MFQLASFSFTFKDYILSNGRCQYKTVRHIISDTINRRQSRSRARREVKWPTVDTIVRRTLQEKKDNTSIADLSELRVTGEGRNGTIVLTEGNFEVAIFAPVSAHAVLYQPIFHLFVRHSVANKHDAVIDLLLVIWAMPCVVDAATIEAHLGGHKVSYR